MPPFLFYLVILLTSCADNSSTKGNKRIGDRLLETPEQLTKDSSDILINDSTLLYTGWYYVIDTPNGYKRQLDKSNETYYLDPKPIVIAKNFTTFEIYESTFNDKQYFGLSINLDKEGTENWSNATRKAEITGTRLAFILDNRLLQVSKVNSQITGGVTALNRGEYSRQELEYFITIIKSEK